MYMFYSNLEGWLIIRNWWLSLRIGEYMPIDPNNISTNEILSMILFNDILKVNGYCFLFIISLVTEKPNGNAVIIKKRKMEYALVRFSL